MTTKTLDQHIECTPGIAGGKPRIAGHRITVQNIALWHDRFGMSADEIATEHACHSPTCMLRWHTTSTTASKSIKASRRVRYSRKPSVSACPRRSARS